MYFDAARPSSISLPVVPLSSLPPFNVLDAVDSMLARHAPKFEANVVNREATDVDFKSWLERRTAKALNFAVDKFAGKK